MNRQPFLLSRLAEASGATLQGHDIEIHDATGFEEAGAGELSFIRAGAPYPVDSKAAAIIVDPDTACPADVTVLRHTNPRYVFAIALGMLQPFERPEPGVHATASVASSATLGDGVHVGPFAVIEDNASIGDGTIVSAHAFIGARVRIGSDCRLDAHAVVHFDCILHDRVHLFSGAVIGADGFGFEVHEDRVQRLHHIGITELESDVEVGANSCIDRATTDRTLIRFGTKIDNHVQIGHNCRIGPMAMIAGQTGIAGSCQIGAGVHIGGGCGIADHARIGDGARLGARSGVAGTVPPGVEWSGTPARDHRANVRAMLALPRLPDVIRDIRRLRSHDDD